MIPVKSKFIDLYVFHKLNDIPHFLLLYRNNHQLYPKTWQSVQGKIHENEIASDAAKRELKEETGLIDVNMWNLDFQNTYYYPKSNEMYIFPVFVAESFTDEIILSSEHSKYKWVTKKEAIDSVIWRCQKQSIAAISNDFFENPNPQKLEFTKI